MELLVQEPNANTAIKCPTDLLAVQTLPCTAICRDVDVNMDSIHQSWMLVYQPLWYSVKQLMNLNVQVSATILLETAELH